MTNGVLLDDLLFDVVGAMLRTDDCASRVATGAVEARDPETSASRAKAFGVERDVIVKMEPKSREVVTVSVVNDRRGTPRFVRID